ncbi:MAG TPA: aminotransferase class IV [Candidatus Paceibacterota bacterium]|nr:aminotransferase class IV [Candidatus Paceibacterota bacterium]
MTAQFPGGEGIFESLKTMGGVPFALTRHLARATRSAAILGMRIQPDTEIRQAVAVVLSKTPQSLEFGRLRIRFHKSGEFDLVHETYHPWTRPARLTILDRPINENSPTAGLKTLPFTENIECLKLAHDEGFDEGVRFNLSGVVSESATSNLLLKIDDRWVTPSLASGCLPGITRELALQWFDIKDRVVTQADLANAESIYLISSLKVAQPVSLLEGRALEIDTKLRQELVNRMAQDIDP